MNEMQQDMATVDGAFIPSMPSRLVRPPIQKET